MRNITYQILLWIVVGFCNQSAISSQTIFESSTVWEERENNIFTHFVYGLTITDKGTILAFAEARINNGSDDGPHHIVLKRSTDKGSNFSESLIFVKSINGQSWANPTPVVDEETGNIFLFYALNHENNSSQVFFIVSEDDGRSWSSSNEITAMFKDNANQWTFHFPGPGHGTQLRDGRLILPVWHRRSISFRPDQRDYGVNAIYSDDNGITWKLGEDTPVGEFNESQIIEGADGDLLMLSRTIAGSNGSHQAKLFSKDRGLTWSNRTVYQEELKGVRCDIGLIRYSGNPNHILVSQPSGNLNRENLVVRLSTDEGCSWNSSKLLQEGPVTYSDLAILPDHTVVCMFGKGGGPTSPNSVRLVRFNSEWLLKD